MTPVDPARLVELLCRRFSVFGGPLDETVTSNNPIAHALKGKPPMFALGVDVRAVVETILNELDEGRAEAPAWQPIAERARRIFTLLRGRLPVEALQTNEDRIALMQAEDELAKCFAPPPSVQGSPPKEHA